MIGAIIQARTGSSRLPGKTLLPLGGMPMLAYILRRLHAGLPDLPVVVATTVLPEDDALVAVCESEKVLWFRGSECDVLDRYYRCALQYGFSQVVRLTADNPFTDLDELTSLIRLHVHSGSDYAHSFSCLPVGAGAEVFTFPCLAQSFCEGFAPHHREHVNEYVLEHADRFRVLSLDVAQSKQRPELRLTVDTLDDYDRACRIVAEVDRTWVRTEDAIAWLSRSA